jgi:hypothetical protein
MNERPTDNPIDALRGPALASERAREAGDLTAMVLAYDAAPADAAPRGIRRRGALVAAAAIASLGLGGLAVAGPGVFAPAADTPPAPAPVVAPATVEAEVDSVEENVERHVTDADVTCAADGNHGQTVSSVARAEGDVAAAAESQCGKPVQSGTDAAELGDDVAEAEAGVERHTTDANVECAEGNHGETVSSVAQAGGDVTAAAHSQCGKPINSGGGEGADESPGEGVERHTTDPNVECAEGNHGKTVSSVAQAGGDVTAAAESQCGMPVQSGDDTDDDTGTDDTNETDGSDASGRGPNEHANERAHERAGRPGNDG